MEKNQLKLLLKFLDTDLYQSQAGEIHRFNRNLPLSPLELDAFRLKLKTRGQENREKAILLYQDSFGLFYAYFEYKASDYFLGPLSLSECSEAFVKKVQVFYNLPLQSYHYKKQTLEEIMEKVILVSSLICHYSFTVEQIYLVKTPPMQTNQQLSIAEEEIEEAHHTYNDERHLLQFVKVGAVEDALSFQHAMDKSIGRLSGQELTHWRNLTIVAITLSTRAAIEGGLTPVVAYKISDDYIQQCDAGKSQKQLYAIRDKAVQTLAERVRDNLKSQTQSSYTKACMAYIHKHYREKIYLEDVADYLGISASHFSKIFKKEVGVSFQHYLIKTRLEYAANLLKFSKESIATISEYVHFPSQSYFGKYFKHYYHMTPREYRKLYQIID